jgi:lysophospholipase L1-like esterase
LNDGGPQWLALPLSAPARGMLALVFHGHALHYENYDYGRPRTYEVQVSNDGEAWRTIRTVTDNMVRSRVELFDAPGASWVRLRFLTAWGDSADREPFLREVAIYEQRSPGAPDVWLVFGDSTTSVGLDPAAPPTFARTVAQQHPGYDPILLSGGTGGDESGNAADRLAVGLPTLPKGSVVGLCYGSNDAKRGEPLASYKANLAAAIAQIRAAGDVPLLATLPWSLNGAVADYADACRDVAAANGLPPGPDFYAYFKAHPDELEVDRVHPNAAGQAAMQRLWAEAAGFRYP